MPTRTVLQNAADVSTDLGDDIDETMVLYVATERHPFVVYDSP